MRACWTFSPSDRISFRSIVDELVSYENEDFHQHAYYHTQPHPIPQANMMESHTHDEEELLLGDNTDDEDNDSDHQEHRQNQV